MGTIWGVYRGYLGRYVGMMEKNMETTNPLLDWKQKSNKAGRLYHSFGLRSIGSDPPRGSSIECKNPKEMTDPKP